MNAKELVKAYGLAGCIKRIGELTDPQLRALAKIADDYGKVEFHSTFLGELQSRQAVKRTSRTVTKGSMAEALAPLGGKAAPFAWYSLGSDGRVILHTWRRPMDGWRLEAGRWTLDSKWGGPDAPWRSLRGYTALLAALDAQASLHGDVVFAALSTDMSGGVGPAKRKPGSSVLLVNSDGSPARFKVAFDLEQRWHRIELLDGQDCDVGAS